MAVASSLLAFLRAYALSLLFFLGRTIAPRWRSVLLVVTVSLTLAAPLIIPASLPVFRCLIATTLVFFITKRWEVRLRPKKYASLSLRTHASFRMNHCLVVPRNTDHFRNGMPLRNRARHFAVRTPYISLATAALYCVFQWDWSHHSFWSEHFLKSAAAFTWIDCAFPWYGAFWHLAGIRTVRFVDQLWLAHTPAQLGRRYHRPAYL